MRHINLGENVQHVPDWRTLSHSVCVFIHTPVVTGKKFGVSELGTDVINYISHATQQRLQNLLEKASQVAQQKNITFKVIFNCSKSGTTRIHLHFLCFNFSWTFLSFLHFAHRRMNGMRRSATCEPSLNSLSSWIRWRSKGRKRRRERFC